jgi:DNA repair exonuclease SbcCD ATPase subunit
LRGIIAGGDEGFPDLAQENLKLKKRIEELEKKVHSLNNRLDYTETLEAENKDLKDALFQSSDTTHINTAINSAVLPYQIKNNALQSMVNRHQELDRRRYEEICNLRQEKKELEEDLQQANGKISELLRRLEEGGTTDDFFNRRGQQLSERELALRQELTDIDNKHKQCLEEHDLAQTELEESEKAAQPFRQGSATRNAMQNAMDELRETIRMKKEECDGHSRDFEACAGKLKQLRPGLTIPRPRTYSSSSTAPSTADSSDCQSTFSRDTRSTSATTVSSVATIIEEDDTTLSLLPKR